MGKSKTIRKLDNGIILQSGYSNGGIYICTKNDRAGYFITGYELLAIYKTKQKIFEKSRGD